MKALKVVFRPRTKTGNWSVIMFLLLIMLLGFFFVMVGIFDQRGGASFFSNLWLTVPMLMAWTAGLISFILGLITLSRTETKPIMVFVVTILTGLTTLYGIMAVID